MEYKFHIEVQDVDTRLDVFLTQKLVEQSRSHIQKLITENRVLVNNHPVKANYRLKLEDHVFVVLPEPKEMQVKPEMIELDVLYEDKELIVINKPQGMVVHPAPGNYNGTLVNALLYHCKDLSGINGILRPGIVHRIDKDTSGVLVVAKTDFSHVALAAQIKAHTINRQYKALVHGHIEEKEGIIRLPIGRHPVDRKKMAVGVKNAKIAETRYFVLEYFLGYTLIQATLKTGRTHQIRVHLSTINHPVVGDPKYSSRKCTLGFTGQALHAEKLGFTHPRTQKYMEFIAPLPNTFACILDRLRRGEKIDG